MVDVIGVTNESLVCATIFDMTFESIDVFGGSENKFKRLFVLFRLELAIDGVERS